MTSLSLSFHADALPNEADRYSNEYDDDNGDSGDGDDENFHKGNEEACVTIHPTELNYDFLLYSYPSSNPSSYLLDLSLDHSTHLQSNQQIPTRKVIPRN